MNARPHSSGRTRRAAVAAGLATLVLSSLVLFGGVGFAKSTIGAAQYQYGQYGKKITICHKNKVTISISVNALPAHKRHGDKVGTCAAVRETEKDKQEAKEKAEKKKAEAKEKAEQAKQEAKEKAEREKNKGKGKSEPPPAEGQGAPGQGHDEGPGKGDKDKGDKAQGEDKGKGKKK